MSNLHLVSLPRYFAMAEIYQDDELAHNIAGVVLVILAKDETKVERIQMEYFC